MERIHIGIICGMGFLMVSLIALDTAPAVAADDIIKKRIELMRKGILGNFRVIKNFAKSGEGSAADVEKAAKGIQAAAAKVLPLFPNGSGRPDYDDNTTRALGKIWYDWPTFKKANSAMSKHASHVAIYAAQGNPEDVKKHFKLMGKEGCGGCHKLFRGAKVE